MKSVVFIFLQCVIPLLSFGKTWHVGEKHIIKKIKEGIAVAQNGDTVLVEKGFYKEGNIVIDKSICFIGRNLPIIDGDRKFEVLSIKANNVTVEGFKI